MSSNKYYSISLRQRFSSVNFQAIRSRPNYMFTKQFWRMNAYVD